MGNQNGNGWESSRDADDWSLLRRFADTRSPEAFSELMRRYGKVVQLTCTRVLRDCHLADDATQIVFQLLMSRAGKLEGGSLGGWLKGAARRVSSNMARDRRTRAAYEQRSGIRVSERPREADLPEIQARAQAILDSLAPGDRAILVGYYLQGRTARELARQLGISHDAVRQRVSRAVNHARQKPNGEQV